MWRRRPPTGAPHPEIERRNRGPCQKVPYRDHARVKASLQRLRRIQRVEGKRPGHLTAYRCPLGVGYDAGHDRRRQTEGG